MQKQGTVIRWDATRAFGFIRSPDTSADVFFHVRDFKGAAAPREGLAVVYEEIHVGGKGPRAMAVHPAAHQGAAPPSPLASHRSTSTSTPHRRSARNAGPRKNPSPTRRGVGDDPPKPLAPPHPLAWRCS